MIVLDTNVISELWRIQPHPTVLAWMNAQTVETLYLSAITVAELRYGIATMPKGRRQTIYHNRLENEVLPMFGKRVLPFELETSRVYSKLMAQARADGKAISKEDGYIAASALTNGFTIATRDESPFRAAGVTVINPWQLPIP